MATAVLWGLWVLSVVPLVMLFFEFNDPQDVCDIGASYYAKLYGHIFVYPITFGLLATVFLTQPWLQTVRSMWDLPAPRRGRVVAFLAISIVGVVSFASWADFTRATPALWSFKPAVHKNETIDAARSVLMAKCKESNGVQPPEQAARDAHKEKPLDILTPSLLADARSVTEWAYYIGFIGNTTWMALLFGVVVTRTGSGDRRHLGRVVAAMALATAWVPFRASFLVEKVKLYTDDLLSFNYLIFLAFVVLYIHILQWYTSGPEGKERKVVLWAGNLIVAMLALLSAMVGPLAKAGWFDGADILVQYFGWKSSPPIYIAMLLLFLVMIAPAAVRRLWGGSSHGTTTEPCAGRQDAEAQQSRAQ